MNVEPLDLSALKVLPLAQRLSLTQVEEILIDPSSPAPNVGVEHSEIIAECADSIHTAVTKRASIILMYGAHLVRNGGALIVSEMMQRKFLTHVATNGAGSIHDWEYAWAGRSTENVAENVAGGIFGAWNETGRFIHLALLANGCRGEGYGVSLGRFIAQEGADIPKAADLEALLRKEPLHPLSSARFEMFKAIQQHCFEPGVQQVTHRWKSASILGRAFETAVPATVHPGIGYDIVSCHPMFNGAAIGRAAELDFKLLGGAIERLDGGVVLSVGSAIMAPQVFEKSLSCVHNLRFQRGRPPVRDFKIFVIDLQDGGNWDWRAGEPPKDNPAYYLRFCKSFSRMGGGMRYVQCDNMAFMHNLLHALRAKQNGSPAL